MILVSFCCSQSSFFHRVTYTKLLRQDASFDDGEPQGAWHIRWCFVVIPFCCSHCFEYQEMSLASCTTVWHASEWLRSEVLFIAVFCLASQLLSMPESASSSLTLGQFVFRTKQPSFRWCFNNVCNSTQYYLCCSHLSSSTRRFWDTKGQCSCRRPRSLDRLQRLMQAVREERKGVKTLPMSPLLAFPLRVVLLSKNKLLFKSCGSTESRADLSWTYSPTGRMITCNSTGIGIVVVEEIEIDWQGKGWHVR